MRFGVLVSIGGQGTSGALLVLGAMFASKLMGPERLGEYTEYALVAGMIFACSNLGLHGWVARGVHRLNVSDVYLMQRYVLTALKVAGAATFVWWLLLISFSLGSSDTLYYLCLAFTAASWVFTRSLALYTISALQARKQFFPAAIIRIAAVVCEYSVVLLAMSLLDASVLARAASQSIGWATLVIALLVFSRHKVSSPTTLGCENSNVSASSLPEAKRFASKTAPHVVFSYAAANLDKFALALVATNEELGVYAFASTLAMVLGTFAEALNFALIPYIYDFIAKNRNGMRGTTGLMATAVLITIATGIALATLADNYIISTFPAYEAALPTFSILLVAQAVRATTMYTSAILTYQNKTQFQSFSTVCALISTCIFATFLTLTGHTVALLYLSFTLLQLGLTICFVFAVAKRKVV